MDLMTLENRVLWIDDERVPPQEYFSGDDDWAQSSAQAINFLTSRKEMGVNYWLMCFDHDLGYTWEDGSSLLDNGVREDDTKRVMQWLIDNDYWPEILIIHSWNPFGAMWLEQQAKEHGPKDMMIIREAYKA